MFKFHQIAVPAATALALLISAGSAFAAAPVFTTAAPGNGMAISDFRSQLDTFNANDVTDFVNAKTVTVYKYDDAWLDQDDNRHAVDLLTGSAQEITLLREALDKNPAAMKLLAEHKILVKDVVDIVSDGAGGVSIYVS